LNIAVQEKEINSSARERSGRRLGTKTKGGLLEAQNLVKEANKLVAKGLQAIWGRTTITDIK